MIIAGSSEGKVAYGHYEIEIVIQPQRSIRVGHSFAFTKYRPTPLRQ
jgi:hypothetical protein